MDCWACCCCCCCCDGQEGTLEEEEEEEFPDTHEEEEEEDVLGGSTREHVAVDNGTWLGTDSVGIAAGALVGRAVTTPISW